MYLHQLREYCLIFCINGPGKILFLHLFPRVNESTWEHMKLIFFPMLLFSLFASARLKEAAPSLTGALILGNLLGTLSIPILFYTYTGITGQNFFIADLAVFFTAVLTAWGAAWKLRDSAKVFRCRILLRSLGCPYVPFVLHLHFSRTGSSSVPCMKQMAVTFTSSLCEQARSRNSYQQDDSTLRKPAHRRNSPQVHHGSPYNTRPALLCSAYGILVQSCSPAAG